MARTTSHPEPRGSERPRVRFGREVAAEPDGQIYDPAQRSATRGTERRNFKRAFAVATPARRPLLTPKRVPPRPNTSEPLRRRSRAADQWRSGVAGLSGQAGSHRRPSVRQGGQERDAELSRCRPGDYVVHVSFGLASAAKTVHLRSDATREAFDLPAGGIRLEGRVGDVRIPAGQISFDVYRGSQFEPGERSARWRRASPPATSWCARGHLLHRLELRRQQRGGALRHPRAGRQAHRRDGHPPRRRHHAQARQRARRRGARQHQLVGAHARRRRGQGIDRRLPARWSWPRAITGRSRATRARPTSATSRSSPASTARSRCWRAEACFLIWRRIFATKRLSDLWPVDQGRSPQREGVQMSVFLRSCLASALVVASVWTGAAAAADAQNGERLARRWCATCHVVTSDQRQATGEAAPFSTIAKMPGFNEAQLAPCSCSRRIRPCRT